MAACEIIHIGASSVKLIGTLVHGRGERRASLSGHAGCVQAGRVSTQ